MAIDVFTGTPGSGKSLDSILEIHDWLENGYNVIANFPIVESKIHVKKEYLKEKVICQRKSAKLTFCSAIS